ncbi:MAG: CinA family nicotinamide mononucleotide deamidase-related protein [Planctomycetaceae bacterium]|mgnify:FL=1|jgi:nicotinamide-nucleotide amidase|nr:CinA family nicotinamide mononucleotide deamidase-related protein [Planctomycetaceae bacterium]MBT4725482.1 CinA family nicotinamide mononucleotide deamidase-related protein [Planctomycetaceae bacterium]MBT4845034.1 CinA family nicotinamide mononucleotide deamidase-related protein [Planctomycetaceae bacterium]MBT5125484.1 CinA family nicotinamide mononucleotide deamidase-related protein [Planctomycetaceae bacterium]MBT5885311.1 CinA family nicotinamide mononucleotide deamidase-related protei
MRKQTTEVIAIGDELSTGQRLDTNSHWLSNQLTNMGLSVQYHSTVADDVNAITDVIRTAKNRSNFILITGGLGPTADDLTREALAAAVDQPLIENPEALQHIINLFKRRSREMAPNNRRQALLPQNATLIHNDEGTAPGVDIIIASSEHRARVFCLPGVPAEMKLMFNSHIIPAIRQDMPGTPQITRQYVVKTFGMGESNLEHKLPQVFQRARSPIVGITASHATITLRFQITAATDEQCQELAQPTLDEIVNTLGDVVFANHEVELGTKVCQLLVQNEETVATWECGTQGQVATMLHAPLYPALVVSRFNLATDGFPFTHDATAVKLTNLATSFQRETGATYAMLVGPVRRSDQSAAVVPRFDVAIADRKGSSVQTHDFTGHPDILLTKAAKQAINQLRLYMKIAQ